MMVVIITINMTIIIFVVKLEYDERNNYYNSQKPCSKNGRR